MVWKKAGLFQKGLLLLPIPGLYICPYRLEMNQFVGISRDFYSAKRRWSEVENQREPTNKKSPKSQRSDDSSAAKKLSLHSQVGRIDFQTNYYD